MQFVERDFLNQETKERIVLLTDFIQLWERYQRKSATYRKDWVHQGNTVKKEVSSASEAGEDRQQGQQLYRVHWKLSLGCPQVGVRRFWQQLPVTLCI